MLFACHSLSRVTFFESSFLKLIGRTTCQGTRLRYFCLPESISSIGEVSFSGCPLKGFVICDSNSFVDVFTGLLVSKDQRICYSCIDELEEVILLNNRRGELCEDCFCWCRSLCHVAFGNSSPLKLIWTMAFSWSGVSEIHIPDGLERVL